MTTHEDLRRLVDALPDSELNAAKRYLEFLHQCADPILQAALEAPEDDEPDTPEDRAAAQAAWQQYRAGDIVSAEQARRELLD